MNRREFLLGGLATIASFFIKNKPANCGGIVEHTSAPIVHENTKDETIAAIYEINGYTFLARFDGRVFSSRNGDEFCEIRVFDTDTSEWYNEIEREWPDE